MHGIGVFLNNKGDIIFGEFKHNKPDGEANLLLSNGSFFRGKFKNGVYDGLGLLIHVDKDVYLMSFRQGMLSGCITYFPKTNKEVYILKYKDNQLRNIVKRYKLGTEQGDEAKYRVLKSVFENSQLSEILYTTTDVQKIIKKVSTSRQKFINSQMVGKEFLYCGVFNNEMEFEGLGLLIDLENKKIKVGDWNKQELNGFGILIQSKYMFKGSFIDNQLDGKILIDNLDTGEYKLCLYDRGCFKAILKEGKGTFPFKGFEFPTLMSATSELKRFPGSEFLQKTSSLNDVRLFGYDLINVKLKAPMILDFIKSKEVNLEDSQIMIAIKDDHIRKHRSKSPYRKNYIGGSAFNNTGTSFDNLEKNFMNSKVTNEVEMILTDRTISFKDLKGWRSRYIEITPNKMKFQDKGKELLIEK